MIYVSFLPEKFPEIIFAHRFNQIKYRSDFKATQANIEVTYIKNGALKLTMENEEFLAEEGGILVLPHNQKFLIETNESDAHIHYTICVNLGENVLVDRINEVSSRITLPVYIPPSEKCRVFAERIGEIIDEFHASSLKGRQKCACKVFLLLCDLYDAQNNGFMHSIDKLNVSEVYSGRIKEYIRKNIDKPVTLADIAVLLEKSPNYLNKIFKNETGSTIVQYINKEKVRKTVELMTKDGLTLKQCCEHVGIKDANYLSRLFKKQMGISASGFKMNSVFNTFYLVDKDKL